MWHEMDLLVRIYFGLIFPKCPPLTSNWVDFMVQLKVNAMSLRVMSLYIFDGNAGAMATMPQNFRPKWQNRNRKAKNSSIKLKIKFSIRWIVSGQIKGKSCTWILCEFNISWLAAGGQWLVLFPQQREIIVTQCYIIAIAVARIRCSCFCCSVLPLCKWARVNVRAFYKNGCDFVEGLQPHIRTKPSTSQRDFIYFLYFIFSRPFWIV